MQLHLQGGKLESATGKSTLSGNHQRAEVRSPSKNPEPYIYDAARAGMDI